jgi:hypothetical protein
MTTRKHVSARLRSIARAAHDQQPRRAHAAPAMNATKTPPEPPVARLEVPVQREVRRACTFQLPESLLEALAEAAFRESRARRSRVTQVEILERALRAELGI